ncbi:hypothetical protein SCLCIDRAFT_1222837, partial [Scleroderma citrinum Foug A]
MSIRTGQTTITGDDQNIIYCKLVRTLQLCWPTECSPDHSISHIHYRLSLSLPPSIDEYKHISTTPGTSRSQQTRKLYMQ